MLIFLLISFVASIAGAICGIGGGIIIKPVLDSLRLADAGVISFLSGCTVLSMSCYSVGRSLLAREGRVSMRTGTPLAIGAALGGVCGKQLMSMLADAVGSMSAVGAVQAICLAVITILTLVYTLCKSRIRTREISRTALCVVIGLLLGVMSSFLGIGGGPINLVVLGYFFGMKTKTAAANSLYIILFSQLASLVTSLVTCTVPTFEPLALVLMVAGGIGGAIAGRAINKRMDDHAVDVLFIGMMCVIICISIYNSARFFMA